LINGFASKMFMRMSRVGTRIKVFVVAAMLTCLLRDISAQDAAAFDAAAHFDYVADAVLDVKEISVQERDSVSVHDVTYMSSDGVVVPAYLVVPKQPGKFAAVLWGHWLMPNSSSANRQEFLDEAVALAPAGVVSLLIDAPQARPGFKPASNPELIARQVVDLRRGVDLLLARGDVDAKRIAYVGHSWDAGTGAILDAMDKRIAAFVFMSGPQSNRQYVLSSDSPRMVAARKGMDMAKVEQTMKTNSWADPGSYAAQLGPAPALFQYGLQDEDWVPLKDAKDYFAMSSGPKEVRFYESGHALNAQARLDRFEFLRQHLGLLPLSRGKLEGVPDTR
jgi:cephalosporin-C deacetylase-like acetyl esterase